MKRIDKHLYFPLPPKEQNIYFFFNGKKVEAYPGDTVASALYSAGIQIFSRSFKYHRPRGLYENQGQGDQTAMTIDGVPNLMADSVLVKEKMVVQTQNAWPSVNFDLMALNDFIFPWLPNGFYYKMFHKPKWAWPWFEKIIRRVAGLGKINTRKPDSNLRYEKRYRFVDVCIVGGGLAGITAALAAASLGKKVLLLETYHKLGGHWLHSIHTVEDCQDTALNSLAEHQAVEQLIQKLTQYPNVEILCSTTAFGVYEDNYIAAFKGKDLFKIRANSAVLATGATDRHLVFGNNDKPGIMTGRGVERLIALHGIKPAKRAIVVTNNDQGYHTAKMLYGAGTKIVAIVDARQRLSERLETEAKNITEHLVFEKTILCAYGRNHVESIAIGDSQGKSISAKFNCDLVVLAVGFKPQLNLLVAGRERPVWDQKRHIFRMPKLPAGIYATGEVNSYAHFSHIYKEGWQTGLAAAKNEAAPESVRDAKDIITALPAAINYHKCKHFICPCMDVTRKEALDSIKEGYDQVETLKRYTSMGMGICQGKTCYEVVARLAASDTNKKDPTPTTMRPPFTPVSFGVLAGRSHHLIPIRRTSMHSCHTQLGAKFLNVGLWKRPEYYTDPQEEALAIRKGLGIIDISTLGKIELSGPDVLPFLHFMLPGKFAKLKVGRTRYSIMVGEDGIFYEDGTLSHIEEGVYYLSTTTGNQEAIVSTFWWWLETSDFNVKLGDLSRVYAAVNIAGENSRALLQDLVEIDVSNKAFPYMSSRKAHISGVAVQLLRIGFTGELSYEIHFPCEYGESMWDLFLQKGEKYNIKPFGVETQRILRLEKGHLIPGIDTDALSTPYAIGLDFAVKSNKKDFIGKAFLQNFRNQKTQERLIAYQLSASAAIPDDGIAILEKGEIIGRVTSSRRSPTLGCGIGLAWVKEKFSQPGTSFSIRLANGKDVEAQVLAHAAYDPEGAKLKS